MESALRLERHFFTRIELRPNVEAKPEGEFSTKWSLTLAQAQDDPNRYQLTLLVNVEQSPESKPKPYYSGAFEIVGFFTIAKECPQERGTFIQVAGGSLLYSAVREMVCNLSARGPWPMIVLPTTNFTPQPQASIQPVIATSSTQENT